MYSSTFNAFAGKLARRLAACYDLYNKEIIEIGCGRGEFLDLLCELGQNRGIGFDPAFVDKNKQGSSGEQVTIISDFYSEKYKDIKSDFICCRMTLEHIHRPSELIKTIKDSIGDRGTIVFFQVPNVVRILRELAFWDIYYEHCSYFSPGSLSRLFRRNGFTVTDLWTDFGSQYIMMGARAGNGEGIYCLSEEEELSDLIKDVNSFAENHKDFLDHWRNRIEKITQSGQKVILWGGGSKSVAFLNTLEIKEKISYVVDKNPNKVGTFIAGTGQRIVSPDFLREYEPDSVIIMNPAYRDEIAEDLRSMELSPEIITV
jgi:SAM-dependent methyltransferase